MADYRASHFNMIASEVFSIPAAIAKSPQFIFIFKIVFALFVYLFIYF